MRNVNRGWFVTEGRDGDRTLEQQMIGLEPLVAEVAGKSVLDFGCAEGLIGMALVQAGAKSVTGLDSVDDHLIVGRRIAQRQGIEILLIQANFNDYDVSTFAPVDVVLLLAVLHKLHDPSAFARAAARLSTDLVLIRLPPSGLVIRDIRSLMAPHDIGEVMADEGFMLERKLPTTGDEWLGYFRRPKKVAAAPAPAAAPTPAPAAAEPAPKIAPAEAVRSVEHVSTAEVPTDKTVVEEPAKSDIPKDADAVTDSKPVVLTEGDAAADLAGTARPDNPDAPVTEPSGPVLTEGDAAADLAGTPRPDNPSVGAEPQQRTRRARAAKE